MRLPVCGHRSGGLQTASVAKGQCNSPPRKAPRRFRRNPGRSRVPPSPRRAFGLAHAPRPARPPTSTSTNSCRCCPGRQHRRRRQHHVPRRPAPPRRRRRPSAIRYCDSRVSGGICGLAEGYCIRSAANRRRRAPKPALDVLTGPGGNLHTVPSARAFTKKVHNGIEYAICSAYAEGFNILAASRSATNSSISPPSATCGTTASVGSAPALSWPSAPSPRTRACNPWKPTGRYPAEGPLDGRRRRGNGRDRPGLTLSAVRALPLAPGQRLPDRVLAALRNQFGDTP